MCESGGMFGFVPADGTQFSVTVARSAAKRFLAKRYHGKE